MNVPKVIKRRFADQLPLRAVVERWNDENGYPQERLECGHEPYYPGPPAKRRRCYWCWKERQ